MYLAFEILINFVDTLLFLFFINSLLKVKKLPMKIINITTFIVVSFVLTLSTFHTFNLNAILLVFLFYELYALACFENKIVFKLLVPITALFLFNLVEIFTIYFVTFIFSVSIEQLMGDDIIRIILMFVTRTLIFSAMFLISLLIKRKTYPDSIENNKRPIFAYMIIPLASTFSMLFITRNYQVNNSDNLYMLVVTISLVAINIISFVQTKALMTNLTRKYNIDLLLKENELKTELYDRTIESYNHLKGWKHDIKFHLNTLGHLASDKSYAQLEAYINNIGYDLENRIIIVNTGNIYLDATISDFISKCNSLNVPLDIELEVPDISYIENIDLCSLFGNITSNAIEAVQKTDDKRISLSVSLMPNKMIRIICENTFDGEVTLNNSQILSRKGGAIHGYGLKNIRKIVNKYDGMMDVNYTDAKFKVTVLIPTVNTQDKKIYIYSSES